MINYKKMLRQSKLILLVYAPNSIRNNFLFPYAFHLFHIHIIINMHKCIFKKKIGGGGDVFFKSSRNFMF